MRKRFEAIDGLRVIACIGIIMMHIQANTSYNINGWFYEHAIPNMTLFVFLFIMISGFSMCAGYLDRFISGDIDLESFFKRRYQKILPFYSFLLLIDLIFEHSLHSVYEASIEVTLLFGLLPNNAIKVIGVSWTLGVIFLFYLLFPAFSVIMKEKKRAWILLLLSIWIVFVCEKYFFNSYFVTESFTPRHNFLYCLPLFVVGGIIYLYNQEIVKICSKLRWLVLWLCIGYTVVCILAPFAKTDFENYIKVIILFSLWLMYAVGVDKKSKLLSSNFMKRCSKISMEMYLAHMVIFRLLQKVGILNLWQNDLFNYFTVVVLDIVILIIFIKAYSLFEKSVRRAIERRMK